MARVLDSWLRGVVLRKLSGGADQPAGASRTRASTSKAFCAQVTRVPAATEQLDIEIGDKTHWMCATVAPGQIEGRFRKDRSKLEGHIIELRLADLAVKVEAGASGPELRLAIQRLKVIGQASSVRSGASSSGGASASGSLRPLQDDPEVRRLLRKPAIEPAAPAPTSAGAAERPAADECGLTAADITISSSQEEALARVPGWGSLWDFAPTQDPGWMESPADEPRPRSYSSSSMRKRARRSAAAAGSGSQDADRGQHTAAGGSSSSSSNASAAPAPAPPSAADLPFATQPPDVEADAGSSSGTEDEAAVAAGPACALAFLRGRNRRRVEPGSDPPTRPHPRPPKLPNYMAILGGSSSQLSAPVP
eukprot:tig00020816_g14153.t1